MKTFDNIEQGSNAWFQKKKTILSGTFLKQIMGTPKAREDAKYELIANRLEIGVDEENENPMARGVRLEPDARTMFELEIGKKVKQTGLCVNDDNEQLGYSPDGLLIDSNDTEDVEIKCPGGKNYVKMWLKNTIPEEYVWQIIQAFVVNPKLEKRYFVGYRPEIDIHPMHIIEVFRKDIPKLVLSVQKTSLDVSDIKAIEEAFLQEVDATLSTIIKL